MKERSKIISRDDLADVQRWQLPEMATSSAIQNTSVEEPEAGHTVSAQSISLPTAEELQAIYAESAQTGHQQGYAAGKKEGLAEGYSEGIARAEAERRALQDILQSFMVPLQALDASVEQSLLALSLEVARQVIRHELQSQPELLLPLLREALKAVPLRSTRPEMHLHPDDLAMLEKLMPELVTQGVFLVADPNIERGGVILSAGIDEDGARPDRRWQGRDLDHAATQLDLRIETRWRATLERLFGELST